MRTVVAVLAGLAGCGRVHFGAVADASSDGPPDTTLDASPDASMALVADAGPDQMVAYVPCSTQIEIDPRGSHDPNGTIVDCTAFFTAGSTSGGNCKSLLASQVYVPGVYPVILQVTDNDGNVATDTAIITVVDAGHPPPVDGLPHWDAGPSQSVTANTLATFDFSASWNPDGQHYYNFEIDFGDGTAAGSTALSCTHTYTTAGSYTAVFTLDNLSLPQAQWPTTSVAVTVN